MTEVVIAEIDGNHWVVGGVERIDEVLFGPLPDDIELSFVRCASRAEFEALKEALAGPEGLPHPPQLWAINPLIVNRLKGQVQAAGGVAAWTIAFTPWSAMLDKAGTAAVAAAAAWLTDKPGARLLLRQDAAEDPAMGDMQRLRARLVAGALARAGADAGRVSEEMREGTAPQGAEDRLEMVGEGG